MDISHTLTGFCFCRCRKKGMDTLHFLTPKSLPSPISTFTPPPLPKHTQLIFSPRRGQSPRVHSTTDDNIPPPTITPPDTVEIRFRRRSRKRAKQQSVDGQGMKAQAQEPATPKKWEDMNLTEKAIQVYMGEKGILFWLNKFAYASIFITIGGWILFRFVGPSLNLYQLDTPPLSPSSMFKGS